MDSPQFSIPDGMKKCQKCEQVKPENEFYERNDGRRYSPCKSCLIAYQRDNYRRNTVKILMSTRAYASKNKDRLQAARKRWEEKNRHELSHKKQAYYRKHAEKLKSRQKQYLSDPDKREKNRVRANQHYHQTKNSPTVRKKRQDYEKQWRQNNKTKHCIRQHRRRARKRGLPDSFTELDSQTAIAAFMNSCAVCNTPFGLVIPVHWDHWIPLANDKCPGTTPDNMVPLCDRCNLSKQDKEAVIWLRLTYGARKAVSIVKKVTDFLISRRGSVKC